MSLSIVFPAYDEESKIEKDMFYASEFLISNDISGEIIIVDDGSTDRTFEIATKLKNSLPANIEIIKHEYNLGKGLAVRSGIMKAICDFILYSDVGGIVPLDYALKGMDLLKNQNKNIAHGSRKLETSNIKKGQDKDRKLVSWFFNRFMLKYLNIPSHLTDTQCGFKIYRKVAAKNLYSELSIGGFLFEIEIILKAVNMGYEIIEFPIEWKCDRDSRISFLGTTPKVIKEYFSLLKMRG